MKKRKFDAIVIGTGFGGAVTACRLVEAEMDICVLERGRRYGPDDFPAFPKTPAPTDEDEANQNNKEKINYSDAYNPPMDFSRWFWNVGQGLWDIRDLRDIVSAQAAGYGGGSLVYANVHLRPPSEVFDQGWPEEYKKDRLTPYYNLAAYMLDVKPIPSNANLAKTEQLDRAAIKLYGGENHESEARQFYPPLAINFEKLTNDENKFKRTQKVCDMRGECWQGCGQQAKNSLDLNYLARVEDKENDTTGEKYATIQTLAEVVSIEPLDEGQDSIGGYRVGYIDHLLEETGNDKPILQFITAKYVFLAAGAINTTELLLRNCQAGPLYNRERVILEADKRIPLPYKGKALGNRYYPNADSFSMIFDCEEPHEADYGPTITSGLLYDAEHPDTYTISFVDGRNISNCDVKLGVSITGQESTATGILVTDPVIESGSWEEGNAMGKILIIPNNPEMDSFRKNENLCVGSLPFATADTPPKKLQEWFLIEEGGFPTDLEPLLGIFRSPLWFRRNRYTESRYKSRYGEQILGQAQFSGPLARRTVQQALTGLPRRSMPQTGFLARTLSSPQGLFSKKVKHNLLGRNLWEMLPTWLRDAIDQDREQLEDYVALFAEKLVNVFLTESANTLSGKVDLKDLSLGLNIKNLNQNDIQGTSRGLLRLAIQLMWGSEVDLARKMAQSVLDLLPQNLGDLIDQFPHLLCWALAYGVGEGRSGMLLTMGRDFYPSRLRFCEAPEKPGSFDESHKLRAYLNSSLTTPWDTQEGVLRKVAEIWGGELRTNPAPPFINRQLTVHSQGGCSMGPGKAPDPNHYVTTSTGQVIGCEGLYVMDAAAFPEPVGVNPSATIAAVAEYKIEQFLQGHFKEKNENSPDKKRAQDWAEETVVDNNGDAVTRIIQLDPFHRPSQESEKPMSVYKPLGLTFKEQMKGFYSFTERSFKDAFVNLDEFLKKETIQAFEKAESDGMAAGREVTTHLHVEINDLSRFLKLHELKEASRVAITKGKVIFSPGSTLDVLDRSSLELFSSSLYNRRNKYFRYALHCVDDNKNDYVINAIKVVRDDPGFDVWHDTATLYFEVIMEGTICQGILRVPVDNFFDSQIGSLNITNTEDPSRKSWALAAFTKFFFGNLIDVYSPEFCRWQDASKNIIRHTHG